MMAKNMHLFVVGTTGGLFTVEFGKKGVTKDFTKVAHCYVWEDEYTDSGDIFGMQKATVMKKHYNEMDNIENQIYANETPIKEGEVVIICGTKEGKNDGFYKVGKLGDYATVCKFEKVCDMEGK